MGKGRRASSRANSAKAGRGQSAAGLMSWPNGAEELDSLSQTSKASAEGNGVSSKKSQVRNIKKTKKKLGESVDSRATIA